jgi:hypothetical protein
LIDMIPQAGVRDLPLKLLLRGNLPASNMCRYGAVGKYLKVSGC